MMRTLPDQDPCMNYKHLLTMSSPKLSLAIFLQQIRYASIAFSRWPEDFSIPMDDFSSGEDEGVQCKWNIPVNGTSHHFLSSGGFRFSHPAHCLLRRAPTTLSVV